MTTDGRRLALRWLAPGTALAILTAAGCATAPPPPPPDPLVDRVYRSVDAREVSHASLYEAAAAAQVVYLGEKHDNPRHHELQLQVLREIVARGRRPAVGFEVFYRHQTSALMSYVKPPASHGGLHGKHKPEDALRRRIGWQSSSRDKSWAFYGPLLQLAREHELTAFGADLSRTLRARITRVGVDALTPVERALLEPGEFSDPVYQRLMEEKFKRAHCGYGNADYLGRLYENWLARNDAMAAAVVATLKENPDGPVVVILGSGHTQYGMAVPERVAALMPGVRQVDIGFTEVSPKRRGADEYLQAREFEGRQFGPEHEYRWFTPPTPGHGGDPCEAFKSRMKKRG